MKVPRPKLIFKINIQERFLSNEFDTSNSTTQELEIGEVLAFKKKPDSKSSGSSRGLRGITSRVANPSRHHAVLKTQMEKRDWKKNNLRTPFNIFSRELCSLLAPLTTPKGDSSR
jgi:hypothetical protein